MAIAYVLPSDWRPGTASYVDSADDFFGGQQLDRGALETRPSNGGVDPENPTAQEIDVRSVGLTAQQIECVLPRETAANIVHSTAATQTAYTAAQRQGAVRDGDA